MQPPAYLWMYTAYLCAAIATTVTWGAGAAAARSGAGPVAVRRTVRWAAVTLAGWLGVVGLLGAGGAFEARLDRPVPYIAFAIALPVLAGFYFLQRSPQTQAVVRGVPQSGLVAIQCYRGAGVIFLILYGLHDLPGVFALPAGLGDMLVGALALPVAAAHARGLKSREHLVIAWNALGLLDLLVAVTLGFLSAPTRFQVLALGAPNALIGAWPTVLIPTFAVPLSVILHLASLKKAFGADGLARGAPRGATAVAEPAAAGTIARPATRT